MIIDSVEIYRVNMPLVYPFRTAFGNNESIESVLVKMHRYPQHFERTIQFSRTERK